MSFRSDHDALLAQAEALRRDLEDAEARLAAAGDDAAEIAALEAQVSRLRDDNARLRAELEAPPAPAPPDPTAPPPRATPAVPAAGSLLRPLVDTTPTARPDRTGFLYVVFIALVLIAFVALALSFL